MFVNPDPQPPAAKVVLPYADPDLGRRRRRSSASLAYLWGAIPAGAVAQSCYLTLWRGDGGVHPGVCCSAWFTSAFTAMASAVVLVTATAALNWCRGGGLAERGGPAYAVTGIAAALLAVAAWWVLDAGGLRPDRSTAGLLLFLAAFTSMPMVAPLWLFGRHRHPDAVGRDVRQMTRP